MVSRMMLAASGVAETGVFPVEVLIKPTPLLRHRRVASAIREAFANSPVSRMILVVVSPAGFGYGIKETVANVKIAFKKIVIRKNGVNFIGAGF